jgi:hypothetical protein
VASAYTLIGALGNDTSAIMELAVSAGGGTDEQMENALEGAERLNTVTSVGGVLGLVSSGGDWNVAERGATAEAFVTGALGNGDAAVKMNVLGKLGDALDKAETILETAGAIDHPKH